MKSLLIILALSLPAAAQLPEQINDTPTMENQEFLLQKINRLEKDYAAITILDGSTTISANAYQFTGNGDVTTPLTLNPSSVTLQGYITNITGNAATVTTNANLSGPITSVGNATTIAGPVPVSKIDLSTFQFVADGVSLNLSGTTFSAKASSVTLLGNTFNTASKLVQLDGAGKLPSIDGSQLTNLPPTSGGAVLASTQTFTGQNTFNNLVTISSAIHFSDGTELFSGNSISTATGYYPIRVATATYLATAPGACGAGEFINALTADGTKTCAAPAGGGDVVLASTQTFTGGNTFVSSTTLIGAVVFPTSTSTTTFSGFLDIGLETIFNSCGGSPDECTATCSSGKRVVGGGCQGTYNGYLLTAAYPSSNTTFRCVWSGGNVTREAYAICARIK